MKTKVIQLDPEYPEIDKINHCAKVIRQGGLVVFPTETVYGIAANFDNQKAITRLREVKKRSPDKPFARLIAQISLIDNLTSHADTKLYKLIDQYWPGPLTVVVPLKDSDKTIGVRIPDNVIAFNLVREAQCSVAAPSANFEGSPPPKTCEEALKELDGLVDIAIDGGPARIGQGSSVVDFTQNQPRVLREGAITQQDVDRTVSKKTVLFVCTGNSCRSVMADYYLKDMVQDRDDVDVYSAGTNVFVRAGASRETRNILSRDGINASAHLSQPITSTLLKKSDLILVMTRAHRQMVLERVPQVEKRVYLLREFGAQPANADIDIDIPDPIGKPAEAYEECAVVIKEAVNKVAELL